MTFAAPYRTGRTSIATAPHSIRLTQILSAKTFRESIKKMKEQRILLIFKDGIVNFDDVAAIVAAPKSSYVYVHIRNREKHLLFQVFDGNCHSEAEREPRDLLVSIRDIAADAADGKYGNLPVCFGFFGDGNGNVKIDVVNPARFASDKNICLIPGVNARAHRRKFFVSLIDSFHNRFKAFGNKFFKFHKFNSVKKDVSDN